VKRLLLNCDQVFDVLTRGPFPTGQPEDEAVERHLRACHECRRLAEALRPAVALLHEAVNANEAMDLPEYQGALPWKRPERRRLSISRLASPPSPSPAAVEKKKDERQTKKRRRATRGEPRQATAISAVRFIAASLLIAALGLLFGGTLFSLGTRDQEKSPHLFIVERNIPGDIFEGIPTKNGLLSLASLKLPAVCIPLSHQPRSPTHASELASALNSGDFAALQCCTNCHRAGLPQTEAKDLVAITQQACTACHRS
jgi:hypothetical protein